MMDGSPVKARDFTDIIEAGARAIRMKEFAGIGIRSEAESGSDGRDANFCKIGRNFEITKKRRRARERVAAIIHSEEEEPVGE